MTVPAIECPTCDWAGEVGECANDGTHGCSPIFDRTWPCPDCDGTGLVDDPQAGDT